MATRVKQGVSSERVENDSVVRNHKGHDVNVSGGSVVLKSDNGHVVVVDPDVYDAIFESHKDESPRWNEQAQ